MYDEKSMFSFMPENRIIENRPFNIEVKTETGWRSVTIPQKVITGWNVPIKREKI